MPALRLVSRCELAVERLAEVRPLVLFGTQPTIPPVRKHGVQQHHSLDEPPEALLGPDSRGYLFLAREIVSRGFVLGVHPTAALGTNDVGPYYLFASWVGAGADLFGLQVLNSILGALTAAIVIGLAEPAVADAADAGRAVAGGWQRIDLTATVIAGDTVSVSSRIGRVTPDEDRRGGRVERVIEGRNQHGAVVVRVEESRWVPSCNAGTTDC
mgnify:CR=1 FL=1